MSRRISTHGWSLLNSMRAAPANSYTRRSAGGQGEAVSRSDFLTSAGIG